MSTKNTRGSTSVSRAARSRAARSRRALSPRLIRRLCFPGLRESRMSLESRLRTLPPPSALVEIEREEEARRGGASVSSSRGIDE